ncbi:MAG: T9SS type A sorting domain-containing protein [Bacteroidia bacterium]|nr:T9SS type A sorting domain-containing protein [Bacteroidia bacterium]
MRKALFCFVIILETLVSYCQSNEISLPYINRDLRPKCDSMVTEIPVNNTWKYKQGAVFKLNASSGFPESMLLYDSVMAVNYRIDVSYTNNLATNAVVKTDTGSGLMAIGNTLFSYNGNNKITMEIMIALPAGDTVKRMEYLYDTNGYMTRKIYSEKASGSWSYKTKDTFIYNGANFLIRNTLYKFSGSTWLANYETTITYDASNHETSRLIDYVLSLSSKQRIDQIWNGSNVVIKDIFNYTPFLTWEHSFRDSNWFDSSGLQIETRTYQKQGSVWVYKERGRCAEGMLPSGIKNFVSNFGIVVYPNPAKEEVNILNTKPNSSYTLYDVTGRIFGVPLEMTDYKITLNTSQLPAGIYFIVITNGQQIQKHKIYVL